MTAGTVTDHVEARAGAYADSVTLMQISREVAGTPGVDAALVAMATELNLDLLDGMGFARPQPVSPNDLLVAIRAGDADSLDAALGVVAAALAARPGDTGGERTELPPRTVASAARRGGPGLALISVPGQHAFAEAMDALDAGCDVMVFSDNVPIAQEIALKDAAAARGLLVMGPDCGTAVVQGVGLGFANATRPGPVGLVAASGTGAQQLMCLLDAAGVGVSAVLGVGGRDLSEQVAGRATKAALDALDADPATELIVLVSKPPAPAVATEIERYAAGLSTPVRLALLGPGRPDLTEVAENVLRALGRPVPSWPSWPGAPATARPGALRGLFSGGTLADETMCIASGLLGSIRSNMPPLPGAPPHAAEGAPPAPGLRGEPDAAGHLVIDFGDDALTAGRPHPMIDQSLRLERLAADAADPATAVVLIDVVLGHGAHPDPAAELAPVIAVASVPVVISLIGTAGDPQGLDAQAEALRAAGAHVFASNAQAARFACNLIER